MMERFESLAKKACTCAAITGPTSGTSRICSALAVRNALRKVQSEQAAMGRTLGPSFGTGFSRGLYGDNMEQRNEALLGGTTHGLAELASIPSTRAWACGLRTTAMESMPGRVKSSV
jgi:hypothetical protein